MKKVITHVEKVFTVIFTETNALEFFYGAEAPSGSKFVIANIETASGVHGFFLMDNDFEITPHYPSHESFQVLLEQLIDEEGYSVYQFICREDLMGWFEKEEL